MADPTKLGELRKKIDEIDNQMLDLLRARANVIEEVRGVKGKQAIYIRPGREAMMLRVLVKQPLGHIPPGLVHRIWREMIGAFTLQEGAMSVALPVLEGEEGFWDIARDHFGSFTPMHACNNSTTALRHVLNGTHQLAALPFPREGDQDVWWRLLLAEQPNMPNIFYAFPFDGMRGNARKTEHQGLVLGTIAPEETGQDKTILVVEWQDIADRKTAEAVSAALPARAAHIFTPAGTEPACSWIELDGFIGPQHAGLQLWLKDNKQHILRDKIVGAYPVPLKP